MGIKIQHWDENKTKQEVLKRFQHAQDARSRIEDQWARNERSIFGEAGITGYAQSLEGAGLLGGVGDSPEQGADNPINVAYTFKNFRFIHSQLSANPPSVAMRPTSSDQEDVRKADAADRVVRFAIRKYRMQEQTDAQTLNTLTYGTGVMKTIWDSTLGDIISFDEETGEVELEGDIQITIPHTWNMFLDPDARNGSEIKWAIERKYMDFDESVARWPDKEDILKAAHIERGSAGNGQVNGKQSTLKETHYNCVELLEYWETGLPTNGYIGRYCLTTSAGGVIESCRPSPFRFPKAGTLAELEKADLPDEVRAARLKKIPQMAQLPYHILTDIDVPNAVWGKSFVEYAAPLQEVLGQIDSAYLDNIRAHGVARLILPEGAELNDDMSNSPWDVSYIKDTNQAPFFMEVPQLMPEMSNTRNNMIGGINDVSGVNESMFGNQSREQSGASMQYATNQGNMIRRRLFNKYVLTVEGVYKSILNLIRKHWPVERMVQVLGNEKAFESIALKGADIDGGYDVVGEYGVTLSLDPITRREEIIALQPMFEKAGIPMRMSLKMMKLNELEGMYDKLDMAEDRQREIFEEMSATGRLIPPEEFQDHVNMIAWAMDYFMSAEFKYMDEQSRELCKQHLRDRIQFAAQEQSGGVSAQPQAPGPAGMPGELPAQPTAEVPATPETVPNPMVNG